LLNDLFGIQTRGGCSCAGPYGQELLGMDFDIVHKFEDALLESFNNKKANVSLVHLKPGWSRLNLNYFFDEKIVDFVLKAVDFVGYHAWEFLPLYKFDLNTNEWKYRKLLKNGTVNNGIKSLNDVNFVTQHKKPHRFHVLKKENSEVKFDYDDWLEQVQLIHKQAIEFMLTEMNLSYEDEIEELFGQDEFGFYEKFGKLRWYLLPSEALKEIKGEKLKSTLTKPVFIPKSYPTSIEYVSKNITNESSTYCGSMKCA
jgi:hypothetical protein